MCVTMFMPIFVTYEYGTTRSDGNQEFDCVVFLVLVICFSSGRT